MPAPDRPFQPDDVKCDHCAKEVPASGAKSRTVDEYVLWFCGVECYEQWREDSKKKNRGADGAPTGPETGASY